MVGKTAGALTLMKQCHQAKQHEQSIFPHHHTFPVTAVVIMMMMPIPFHNGLEEAVKNNDFC